MKVSKALEIVKKRRKLWLILALKKCHLLAYKLSTTFFSLFYRISRRKKRNTQELKPRENTYTPSQNTSSLPYSLLSLLYWPWWSIYRPQEKGLPNISRRIKSEPQRPDSCRGSAARAAFPRQNLGRYACAFCWRSVIPCRPRWRF